MDERGFPSRSEHLSILQLVFLRQRSSVPSSSVYSYQLLTRTNHPGEAAINHEGTYQMDLIFQKSTAMLQQALSSPSQPFFLGIAPTAPHMEVQFNGSFTEPIPPPEYAGLFNGTVVPRVPNWNEPVGGPGGGVSWLKGLAGLNETVVDYVRVSFRFVCSSRVD